MNFKYDKLEEQSTAAKIVGEIRDEEGTLMTKFNERK